VLEKPLQPHAIETLKAADHIQVQDPVDRLPQYPRRSRIERIVLSSTWTKAITASEECCLIDLIQDSDDSALDDCIFQGAYPEGTLTTASFGDISPGDWLCPIGPLMHSSMQVLKPGLHVLPIRFPRHSVYTWSRVPLEREVRLPQAVHREVVE
jgi:hypothetical protein